MADDQPSPSASKPALIASCHCNRVRLQLPSKPIELLECQCTVCYKYGSLWCYYPRNKVVILTGADQLQEYVRDDSDGDISFVRCAHCGCMILWWGLGEYAGPEHKMGVNSRMLPMSEIEGIERRVSPGPK